MPDASHVAADDGGAFPHRLGDRETEAFAGRFLQDNSGRSLQRVHQGWIIDRKNNDVFIGNALDRLEDLAALRIIGGVVTDQDEPAVDLLSRLSESFNDSHRVLPSVE